MIGRKKIYIILTFTGTILSRLIRLWTKDEYCHVSIALDKDLNDIYSFGRINPYNPFIGGFIKEGIDIGTFKRFRNTKTAIYSLDVSNLQYRRVVKKIKHFKKNKKLYKFNIIGLFSVALKVPFKRENYFYCSEFVKYIIEEAKIDLDLPDLVRPMDFKKNNLDLIYTGYLKNYQREKID